MSSWKIVQESIKRSMKDLRELYETQEQEKQALYTQFQQKLKDSQNEIHRLRSDLESEKALNSELRRQLNALKGDPNRTIQEGVISPSDVRIQSEEDTAQIHFGEETVEENATATLRKSLEEAERRAEEQRLEEEAKRILEVQKEREREYQARVQAEEQRRKAEEERRVEMERMRKQQQEEQKKAFEAEQRRKQQEETNQHLAALEKSYSEVCAQLSLAKREQSSSSQQQELQKRFESQLQEVEKERSQIQKEYTAAKKEMVDRHAQELQGFQQKLDSSGTNPRVKENENEA